MFVPLSCHSATQLFNTSPSHLCVNSKSFSKLQFSLVQPSSSPGYKKVNHGGLYFCRRLTSSIHSPCKFILYTNSISMQLPCCRFIIYIVYLYSSVTSLSVHCRQTPPPFLWWEILTKIDWAICETIEVQYTLRLPFALRNFNCSKINRGWGRNLNLLLVYEMRARRRLKRVQVHTHQCAHRDLRRVCEI